RDDSDAGRKKTFLQSASLQEMMAGISHSEQRKKRDPVPNNASESSPAPETKRNVDAYPENVYSSEWTEQLKHDVEADRMNDAEIIITDENGKPLPKCRDMRGKSGFFRKCRLTNQKK
ncbi:MAG: hypothetical protein J5627_01480, partial [Bacilli bacterium]|nr:hypothetical protein [Bacilli bacterium]